MNAAYTAGKAIFVKNGEVFAPLTNVSSSLFQFKHLTSVGSWKIEWYNLNSSGWNTNSSGIVETTRTINGKALSSNITLTASDVGALADDSVAAGITSSDISNWNAKVSDDKTWNGVTLNKSSQITQANIYIPYFASTSATTASLVAVVTDTVGLDAAKTIPKYNNSGYLVSTTPTAGDSSTKVATTAFV
jgi:hypothetical protein